MKLCKDCKKPRGHENPLISRCKECSYKRQELKQTRVKPIAQKSKTNSNTPAKFTQETKDLIKARDKVCIISGEPIDEYHHIYYGGNANRGANRNDVDQGVGLSHNVHRIIHHASPKESKLAKIYRAKCISYVLSL